MQILKIVFFIISSIGFYLYTERKTDIKKEFIPIILISTITVIMFLAGIFNYMKFIATSIGITGFSLAIYEIYQIVKNKKKIKLNINLVIYFIILCLFAYLLKGIKLTHYDNFSHWGMIIKDILLNDRLPNFSSHTIMFTSYPPGTACFVYYVCTFLGNSEALMLFAQSILVLSSIYPIFYLCKKESKSNLIIAILSMIYLLLGNIFINNLLVDTILPIMGLAALIIIEYYKKDGKKGLIYSIPILSMLMIVKNSGIFFVIIDLVIWLIYYVKNNGIKELFKTKYALIIFVPFLLLYVWNGHTSLVFSEADTAKHSMSITNYTEVFEEKTTRDIKNIFKKFVKENLSMSNENVIMLTLLSSFIIMYIISNKESRKDIRFWFLTFIFGYAIYQISLFAMYLYSMPLFEAKDLAGYVRYHRTIVLFEFGIFIYSALKAINNYEETEKIKKSIFTSIVILIGVLAVAVSPNKINMLYKRNINNNTVRYEILDIKNQNKIEEGKKYLVYISNDQNFTPDYVYFICEYEFMSPNVSVIRNFSGLENKIYNYDYLIILRDSVESNQKIEELGGELNQNVIKIRK